MPTGNPNAKTGFWQNGLVPTLAMLGGAPNFAQGIQQVNNQNIDNAIYKMQLEQAALKRSQTASQYGKYMQVATPQDGQYAGQTFLNPEELDKAAAWQANQDFGNAQSQLNRGQIPTNYGIAPAAQVQQQGQELNKRQATVQDTHATMQQLPQFATGQKPGFNSGLVQSQQQPELPAMFTPDSTNQDPTISTGVQQSDWGNQSPYTMGVPNISELNTARNNEQSNANTAYANQTYRQHYQTSDATDNRELNAKIAGQGYFHQYPPSAGSNPWTAMNAQQNYTQGQVASIDEELKRMGYMDKHGKFTPIPQNSAPGLFGIGGHTQTPQERHAQDLLALRSQLQNQILPFGGSAQTNLQGGFAGWKANRK